MCVRQARYDEVLEHGRVLDSGEFKSHPYPIGEYWEKKDGIKVRAIICRACEVRIFDFYFNNAGSHDQGFQGDATMDSYIINS